MKVRSSYLQSKAPNLYRVLWSLTPIALVYAIVLVLVFGLSLVFRWSVIKFFIDIMMGWTLLSIPFVGVLIVLLDKTVVIEQVIDYHGKVIEEVKPKSWRFSVIWGITLCISGLLALYYSAEYKRYYDFQCTTFYVDSNHKLYHYLDDCKYGRDENEADESVKLDTVKGFNLLDIDYSLCDACQEYAEDAELEYENMRYCRR